MKRKRGEILFHKKVTIVMNLVQVCLGLEKTNQSQSQLQGKDNMQLPSTKLTSFPCEKKKKERV